MKIKVKLGSGELESFVKFLKNNGYDFDILESPEVIVESLELPTISSIECGENNGVSSEQNNNDMGLSDINVPYDSSIIAE